MRISAHDHGTIFYRTTKLECQSLKKKKTQQMTVEKELLFTDTVAAGCIKLQEINILERMTTLRVARRCNNWPISLEKSA